MTDDFHFASPPDPSLDQDEYFERCWDGPVGMTIDRTVENGDEVFIRYRAEREGADPFHNTELFTTRDGKVASVQVFFGPTLPS